VKKLRQAFIQMFPAKFLASPGRSLEISCVGRGLSGYLANVIAFLGNASVRAAFALAIDIRLESFVIGNASGW
jgi:hypothetical protein